MKRLAAIIAALALSGCASLVQDDWHSHPTHAPLQAHHVEVPQKDIQRVCGDPAGLHVHGCAMRVADARICIIYTPPSPAAWLLEHERKHCAGWDHGPQQTTSPTLVTAASPLSPANLHAPR